MSQNFPVGVFKWVEDTSEFSNVFIETTKEMLMKDIFLKLMFNIVKTCMTFTMIYPYCLIESKLEKLKNL